MRHPIQQFLFKPTIWIPLGVSALMNLITWLILLGNITPQANLIVLHYSVYFGVDLVGTWYETLWIPAIGLLIFLNNTAFAYYFYNRHRVLHHFFVFMTPLLEFFVLSAALFIVIANLPASI